MVGTMMDRQRYILSALGIKYGIGRMVATKAFATAMLLPDRRRFHIAVAEQRSQMCQAHIHDPASLALAKYARGSSLRKTLSMPSRLKPL